MRDRFRSPYDLTPLPRLYRISAMGQRLAFYCLDKTMATGNVDPGYVGRSRARIMDVVPANTWGFVITTAAGYEGFIEVVNRPPCKRDGGRIVTVRSDYYICFTALLTRLD